MEVLHRYIPFIYDYSLLLLEISSHHTAPPYLHSMNECLDWTNTIYHAKHWFIIAFAN